MAIELFRRYHGNPILTADLWPEMVNTVFNPGAVGTTDKPFCSCVAVTCGFRLQPQRDSTRASTLRESTGPSAGIG
jgi:hypothetical protein